MKFSLSAISTWLPSLSCLLKCNRLDVIQVFDSLDSDHIGGTYKVSRRDDTPVNTEEFLKAFGSASELAKENDEWNEDDILKILSGDDWKIEYIEVIQVSY